jgi:hypothetical protein
MSIRKPGAGSHELKYHLNEILTTKLTKNQLDTKKLRALRVLRGEYLSTFKIAGLIEVQ